jgi:hypothetical protein
MDCSGLYLICEAIKISESESLNSTKTGNKKRKNSNEDKILTRKKRTPVYICLNYFALIFFILINFL